MCGIFAIAGSEHAGKEAYVGLMQLQHRGQDAAGILSFDSKKSPKITIKNGLGLVESVFSEVDKLSGEMAIGFTRYPTVGIGDESEVQPFFLRHPDGIGLAFNGNIVNYPSLKDKMLSENRRFMCTNCDAEVILHVFADSYAKGNGIEHVFEAVKSVYEKVIGAYSCVMLIAGKGILVFRDPNGIRPLEIGFRLNGLKTFAAASESTALSVLGFSEIRSVKPGEAIFVDMDLNVTSKIISQKEITHCSFEWIYFSNVESKIEGKSVYETRSNLGVLLAKKLKSKFPDFKADCVIPVPDTSRTAAVAMARELGIQYEEGLIKNRYIHRTFIMPTQKKRVDAMMLKFKPVEYVLKGKNVIVVEDSIVRGTTSKRLVKILKESGVKGIIFVSTFPPIKNPCYYGIDFQTKEELIANKKTIKEIETDLEVDILLYLDAADLKNAIGINTLCMACVDGKYPTDVSEVVKLSKLRQEHLEIIEKNENTANRK